MFYYLIFQLLNDVVKIYEIEINVVYVYRCFQDCSFDNCYIYYI